MAQARSARLNSDGEYQWPAPLATHLAKAAVSPQDATTINSLLKPLQDYGNAMLALSTDSAPATFASNLSDLACLIQRIAAIRKPQLYNALNPRIDPARIASNKIKALSYIVINSFIMGEQMDQLRVVGLTVLQAKELQRDLTQHQQDLSSIRIEDQDETLEGYRHGIEPVTVLSFMLGSQAIHALASYLHKRRARLRSEIRFEAVKADGTKVRLAIKRSGDTEEAAKADVIEALRAEGFSELLK